MLIYFKSNMFTTTILALLVFLTVERATGSICPPPVYDCRCAFKDYPCANGFSYGCKNGRCWSQCAALLAGCNEWCYTANAATGQLYFCTKDSDCKDGVYCDRAKCSGGCTLKRSSDMYRRLLLRY